MICFVLLFLLSSSLLSSETFAYKHSEGQQYRIISEVDEEVHINRRLYYETRILNRISVKVLESVGDANRIYTTYQRSEETEDSFYAFLDERDAVFSIDPRGRYSGIPDDSPIPAVRHVPTFPEEDIPLGSGWRAPGEDVHDLRTFPGIDATLKIPFTANYVYRGPRRFNGKTCQRIDITYSFVHETRDDPAFRSLSLRDQTMIPDKIVSRNEITLTWDVDIGLPVEEEEDFEIEYHLASGDIYTFKGRARGRLYLAERMDKKNIIDEVEEELQQKGVDAELTETEKGLTISMDSLYFHPNSPMMLPNEERKLDVIGSILQKYPDRDILITGHTADVGDPDGQKLLSKQRAATVEGRFIEMGIRKKDRIVIQGMGGTVPAASNATEAGRKKNRRVEITILEN